MDDRYLLDTNVFITAKRTYYSFRICPGFWKGIIQSNEKRRIFSIDRVRREILVYPKTEELVKWIKSELSKNFFLSSNIDVVMDRYNKIMLWANQNTQYSDGAKSDFARNADSWLIAYA